MAKITTDSITLEFVYSPLAISSGIAVVGNVPPVQQYDMATGLYIPDFTQIFLMLRPWEDIADPDNVLSAAEKKCTNYTWHCIENGTTTQITTGTDYAIAADGTLTVKRNINPSYPASFRCGRDYLDSRTGELYHLEDTITLRTETVSNPPVLSVDSPLAINYDPVRDTSPVRKIPVRFRIGENDVPAANREFVWQKKDATDTAFQDIDGTDAMDYDVSLNADKTELTVDCSLIGHRIDIRVYAKYNPYGSPSQVVIDEHTPMVEFSVSRFETTLHPKILASRRFYPSQKAIKPECVVSDPKGIILNPDSVVDISWYMSKNSTSGNVTKGSIVATGAKPTIPTANIAKLYGGTLIAEAKVKEPLKAASTGGKVVAVGGKILLVR